MIPRYVYLILYGSILFAFLLGIRRYRLLDRALRIFVALLGLTFLTECLAYYCAVQFRNSMPVYGVFNPIQLFLVCSYFNESVDVLRGRRIGFLMGLAGIAIGVANIIFLQPLNTFNSYFLIFECIVIISLSLFSFARLMLLQYEEDDSPLYWNPHFWIAAILVFFWSITFFNWGAYGMLNAMYPQKVWIVNLGILVVNMITYSSIGAVYYYYPKLYRKR